MHVKTLRDFGVAAHYTQLDICLGGSTQAGFVTTVPGIPFVPRSKTGGWFDDSLIDIDGSSVVKKRELPLSPCQL